VCRLARSSGEGCDEQVLIPTQSAQQLLTPFPELTGSGVSPDKTGSCWTHVTPHWYQTFSRAFHQLHITHCRGTPAYAAASPLEAPIGNVTYFCLMIRVIKPEPENQSHGTFTARRVAGQGWPATLPGFGFLGKSRHLSAASSSQPPATPCLWQCQATGPAACVGQQEAPGQRTAVEGSSLCRRLSFATGFQSKVPLSPAASPPASAEPPTSSRWRRPSRDGGSSGGVLTCGGAGGASRRVS